MAEYIEREAFLADKKWLYCTDCDKRKGKKRGKMVTLYEIGEAPCKSCGIHDMLEEVEVYPAADVQPVVKAHFSLVDGYSIPALGYDIKGLECSNCGATYIAQTWVKKFNFCPNCGAKMEGEGNV